MSNVVKLQAMAAMLSVRRNGTQCVQPRGCPVGPKANFDIRLSRRQCSHSARPTMTSTIAMTIKGMVSMSVEETSFANVMIIFLPRVVAQAEHGQQLETEQNQPSDCERFEKVYGRWLQMLQFHLLHLIDLLEHVVQHG